MNPADTLDSIVNIFKGIFGFIGKIFSFTGNIISKLYNLFIEFTRTICVSLGIMGLSSELLKIALSGLVGVIVLAIFSLIPDLITFLTCRLSKKYRKLTTKEEKSEYTSKHTHFLLRLFLSMRNASLRRKAARVARRAEKLAERRNVEEERVPETPEYEEVLDEVIEESLSDAYEAPEIEIPVEEVNVEDVPVHFPEVEEVPTVENNIKILYSSNIIGKMLRKGVVLDRRMSTTDNPVLIDFSGEKPKEVFTGHLCDNESGIRYKKMVEGSIVEYMLDDPALLANPKLVESINDADMLRKLRERLQADIRYQSNLHNFFTIHDKAMIKSRES